MLYKNTTLGYKLNHHLPSDAQLLRVPTVTRTGPTHDVNLVFF